MTMEAGQGSGSSERMGGYDQFISLLFYVLQIIYVSYIHLCCFICSNDFILSLLSYYNMLYLFVLILQSCCLCFYLFIFNCSVSLHAYYIYMIYMLHMLCVLMIHIVMDIFEITISMVNYLLYVIIIMLIYGIKMIRKMPIILTGMPPFQTERYAGASPVRGGGGCELRVAVGVIGFRAVAGSVLRCREEDPIRCADHRGRQRSPRACSFEGGEWTRVVLVSASLSGITFLARIRCGVAAVRRW
jgi:hypothetical protein